MVPLPVFAPNHFFGGDGATTRRWTPRQLDDPRQDGAAGYRRRHGPGKWRKRVIVAMRIFNGYEELKTAVGTEVGVSDWIEVTQRRINKFA